MPLRRQSESAPTERFYHPELDILRFIAFLLVFTHHALWHTGGTSFAGRLVPWIAMPGSFGVDVFFVLSSYLITELLLREREAFGTIDVRSFYMRRMLRIWPLYFIFLAFAAGAVHWRVGNFITWQAALAFSLFVGNWWVAFHGMPSFLAFPLWSVSIEEQFYLTFPIVLCRIRDRGLILLSFFMIVTACIAQYILGARHAGYTQVWCNTLSRLDPIAAGILASVVLHRHSPQFGPMIRLVLFASGLTCLCLSANVCGVGDVSPTPLQNVTGYPLAAIGGVSMLLSLLSNSPIVQRGGLVYLGRISYGLYVFHPLGLWVSKQVVSGYNTTGARTVLYAAVGLAITIGFAALSFRFLESPFLALKHRFAHVRSH